MTSNTLFEQSFYFVYLLFLFVLYLNFRKLSVENILLEQYRYYLAHNWDDNGVHTFPRHICAKVNVILSLGFKRAYSNISS